MTKAYDKITEELEMEPPKFIVNQYVRGVYEFVVDGEKTLLCPELPPRCIDKGTAGPGLVAQTIISKCLNHIPHYPFVNMINRQCHMKLPESTVHDWFNRGVFWLEQIVARCEQLLQACHYQQMDETKVVIMIHPTNGKSKQGFMILQLAVLERIVVFTASVSRKEEVLKELIGEFCGVLQTDGLEQYDTICKNNPKLIHVGCAAGSNALKSWFLGFFFCILL
ncbi:MAG: transposase [Chitinivibrionales bacterium]|nr:transposase [Chitinivibrionales bacterium]